MPLAAIAFDSISVPGLVARRGRQDRGESTAAERLSIQPAALVGRALEELFPTWLTRREAGRDDLAGTARRWGRASTTARVAGAPRIQPPC